AKVLIDRQASQPSVTVHVHPQGQQTNVEAEQLRAHVAALQAQGDRDRLQKEQDERQRREQEPPRADAQQRAPLPAPHPQPKKEPLRKEPPQIERPAPPAARPSQPRLFDVAVTVAMENVRLYDCNPLLTLSEAVVIRVGGRTLNLGVQTNNRSAVGMI